MVFAMMPPRWTVVVGDKARKSIAQLDLTVQKRITRFFVERLEPCEEPEKLGKALTGKLQGNWRFRVGDYRIIARIERNRLVILVVEVDHRSDVYR